MSISTYNLHAGEHVLTTKTYCILRKQEQHSRKTATNCYFIHSKWLTYDYSTAQDLVAHQAEKQCLLELCSVFRQRTAFSAAVSISRPSSVSLWGPKKVRCRPATSRQSAWRNIEAHILEPEYAQLPPCVQVPAANLARWSVWPLASASFHVPHSWLEVNCHAQWNINLKWTNFVCKRSIVLQKKVRENHCAEILASLKLRRIFMCIFETFKVYFIAIK